MKARTHKKVEFKINTKRPQMFADEPFEVVKQQARKISDLKNLGPASEAQFAKAGIKTAAQFIKMGWKKAFDQLVKSDPRLAHGMYGYALIGALQNKEWSKISPHDKQNALKHAAELRLKYKNKTQKKK